MFRHPFDWWLCTVQRLFGPGHQHKNNRHAATPPTITSASAFSVAMLGPSYRCLKHGVGVGRSFPGPMLPGTYRHHQEVHFCLADSLSHVHSMVA